MRYFKIIAFCLLILLGIWAFRPIRPNYLHSTLPSRPPATTDIFARGSVESLIGGLEVSVREKLLTIRGNGFVVYENPNRIRMDLSFAGKKEIKLASDGDSFWFWYRRLDPTTIYTGKVSENVPLKAPFRPEWIAQCLSLGQVSGKKYHYKDFWLYEGHFLVDNRVLRKITVVDPKRNLVLGNYLYDGESIVVSSENLDFYYFDRYVLPKTIRSVWYEEGIEVKWHLNRPTINKPVDPDFWRIPSGYRYQDISGRSDG